MSSDDNVTITIDQADDGEISAMIQCPQFVDTSDGHASIEDAVDWIANRLQGTDPFAPYEDE